MGLQDRRGRTGAASHRARRRLVWVGSALVAALGVGVFLQGGLAQVAPSNLPGGPRPPATTSDESLGEPSGSSGSDDGSPGGSESQPTRTGEPGPSSPTSLDPDDFPTIPDCIAPRQFSVLTFNIHGGRGNHGLDLEAVADEIKRARADVVLLQEVDRNLARTDFVDQPEILGRLLDMAVYYRANVRSNAILTRLPVLEWSSTALPVQPGKEQRRLVRAAVLVEGQLVQVFDTHLDHTSSTLRRIQIRAVQTLISAYADQPVVLGADLNATADGATVRAIRSSLEDAWESAGKGSGNTVPAGNPKRRIDYVLHNSWLSARSAQVLPPGASDHRALRVGFDLWGSEGCSAGGG